MVSRDSASGFGIGVLAGAAIGLAIGILLAPQSGKETREQVRARASDVMEKVKSGIDKAKGRVRELVPSDSEKEPSSFSLEGRRLELAPYLIRG